MVEPRNPRAKEHFRQNRQAIARGLRLFLEGWVLEAIGVVERALPTRLFDGMARSRVRKVVQPYVDDIVAWAESLGG